MLPLEIKRFVIRSKLNGNIGGEAVHVDSQQEFYCLKALDCELENILNLQKLTQSFCEVQQYVSPNPGIGLRRSEIR
jgi:hypothetical protein